ncbi:peptidase T [Clostridium sp. D2Q-11]|uniref:Peptidase T n=1 Tax=Anaeromonas frigoriresistens TaxID=2683708 RepID=A0A942V333_9FIRM|nr:peptidase T [Anaeromonas frigoriresistens]MBS4539072.1 peptidase T [Anaeromonas frigoriresistens]
MNNVVERFIKYIKFDTQSDPTSETCPTTSKQLDFAKELYKELMEIGLKDVSLDQNGYLMANLPSNTDKDVPTIGFIAHMDTAPDMTGKNVNPQIVENYDGKDIVLNKDKNIILSPKDFPEILDYKNMDLITTDGTTLLGADDKAGLAEIVTAMEYLINHPEIKHGEIKVGFTPDEEVGRGADKFDVAKFGADFAYTMDGGPIGELEYENFNAAEAIVHIQGRNVHPGSAKNKMINSIIIGTEFNLMLPENSKPEYTEKYEGFYHLISFEGSVENTKLHYIIRDHDKDKFENKKRIINDIVDFLNSKYGENTVSIEIKDQYYNMKEKIEPVMDIVYNAKKAMESIDIIPDIKPIRGGTDGSRLSYMGLPCPNIFTGGHNFHGKFEFIPIHSIKKAVELIVKIAELNVENN